MLCLCLIAIFRASVCFCEPNFLTYSMRGEFLYQCPRTGGDRCGPQRPFGGCTAGSSLGPQFGPGSRTDTRTDTPATATLGNKDMAYYIMLLNVKPYPYNTIMVTANYIFIEGVHHSYSFPLKWWIICCLH